MISEKNIIKKFNFDKFYFSLASSSDILNFDLSTEEQVILAKFKSEKKKIEFSLGRTVAKSVLNELLPEKSHSLLPRDSGEVIWPVNYCGSISHCNLYREGEKQKQLIAISLVCKTEEFTSVGVDIEHIERKLSNGMFQKIACESEIKSFSREPDAALKIFCAKEAIYKALFPKVNTYIGFLDVILEPSSKKNIYKATLVKDFNTYYSQGFNFEVHIMKHQELMLAFLGFPKKG